MSENPMLGKIQALINKAQSTDSAAEREALLAKADELMQKYAIDAAMLAAVKKLNGGKQEDPTKDLLQFGQRGEDMLNQWYNLIIAVAEHYDCRFFGWSSGTGYLIGFPSNIEMVKMLYTSLHLHALTKLDPTPDKERMFDENVYNLHEAGLRWKDIAFLMNQAYHEAQELGFELYDGWTLIPWDEKKKDGGRLIRTCKAYATKIGEPYKATTSPILFRRSYAQGFLNEVRDRFAILKKHKEQQVASTTGAELVLVDRSKQVDVLFEELKKRDGHKEKLRSVRVQGEAYDRGRAEGKRADLGQTRVDGGRKGIDQ